MILCLLACSSAIAAGCANQPAVRESGFLSDYSRLEMEDDSRRVYASGRASEYHSFIVDPVLVTTPVTKLSAEDRAEAMRYFHEKAVGTLQKSNFRLTDDPGVGVARLRIALTDVASSTWWLKLHPVSKAMGAGTGGAAMEAEAIDSVTGEQIGAVIQAGIGNQFDLTAYSTLADVKGAIDSWAEIATERFREIRAKAAVPER